MRTRTRSRLRIAVALAAGTCVAGPAPGAAADGLPIVGIVDTTSQGVLNASGAQRYLAASGRADETLVMRVATGSGQLLRHTWIAGEYSVPGVAIDGDTSGISEDGRTLVLIRPRITFPQRETSLAVLDAERLSVERRIELDGDFSFDAISPDGTTAFMVQYPDPRDRTHYRLRVLDLRTGKLEPGSLLPENEPGEEMRGFPWRGRPPPRGAGSSRSTTAGGRPRLRPGRAGRAVRPRDRHGRRTHALHRPRLGHRPPHALEPAAAAERRRGARSRSSARRGARWGGSTSRPARRSRGLPIRRRAEAEEGGFPATTAAGAALLAPIALAVALFRAVGPTDRHEGRAGRRGRPGAPGSPRIIRRGAVRARRGQAEPRTAGWSSTG